jgi:tetratricopeptide (TPR) repeat protein
MCSKLIGQKMTQAKLETYAEKKLAYKVGAEKDSPMPPWTSVDFERATFERNVAAQTVAAKLTEAERLWAAEHSRDLSLRLYKEAYEMAKATANELLQASVGMRFGYVLLELGLPKDALEKFTFAYSIAQKIGDDKQAYSAKQSVGIALQQIAHVDIMRLLVETTAIKESSGNTNYRHQPATTLTEEANPPSAGTTGDSTDEDRVPHDQECAWAVVNKEQQIDEADRNMEELLQAEEKQVRVTRKQKQKMKKKRLMAVEAAQ